MKSKIASITVSLSWIFMIVVGTFFLLIAYNIIAKYQSIEEDKYEIELKWALREVFNNVGRTSGIEETKLNPLSTLFKDKKVEILCNEGEPILSLNEQLDSSNEFLQNYPTFITLIDQEKKDNSYLAVESFRMPFKITSTLAIISQKNYIVFDSNSKSSQNLVDKFRKSSYSELNFIVEDLETLNKDTFVDNIKNKNYNSIVFVSDFDKSFDYSILNELDTYALHVGFKEIDSKSGVIVFTSANLNKTNFSYIDWDESLTLQTMAIFSTPEVFDCSYELIIENTIKTYDFYMYKTKSLSEISKNTWVCSVGIGSQFSQSVNYDVLYQSFNKTKTLIEKEKFNKASDLISLLGDIETNQNQLEEFTCAFIY